jgi:hypothetical protein
VEEKAFSMNSLFTVFDKSSQDEEETGNSSRAKERTEEL